MVRRRIRLGLSRCCSQRRKGKGLKGRDIRSGLRDGKRIYSSAVTAVSIQWPKILAAAAVDFAFIDAEHSALNRETLAWMCSAFAAAGIPPVVRIPTRNPDDAAIALDGGASGFIVPYLETVSQVRQFEAVARYRPLKGRRLTEAIDAPSSLGPDLADYLFERNRDTIFIANIESVPAMECLDELLAVGAIDCVLIGPHDLSCSLGIPEQYDNPPFDRAVRDIIRTARRHRVGAGIHSFWGIERELDWASSAGSNLFMHSADSVIFGQQLKREMDQLRQAVDDLPTVQEWNPAVI